MRNRYPGRCAECGQHVLAEYGEAQKREGRWVVVCEDCSSDSDARQGGQASRTLGLDGTVNMPFDRAALPILRGAPGARWQPDSKTWRWSVDDSDLPRTLECADRLGLEVPAELRFRASSGTERTREAESQIARIEERSGCKLYPFQRVGVEFLARGDRRLLGDDMGLGKTIQVLAALPSDARAVVVCPATLKLNWAAECRKWRPDLAPVVCSGKKGRKAFRIPQSGELVILNYDIIPADAPDLSGVYLVADEAQLLKNSKTSRSKRFRALRDSAKAVWFLTATPLTDRPLDLWGVTCSLGGQNPLGSWSSFCNLFGAFKNRWGGYEFSEPRADVPERLRRVMLRRTKAEVLPDLPKKSRQFIAVNGLSSAVSAECAAALKQWDASGDELPPFRALSKIRALLAESRIPAMLEQVESHEDSDEPLVVFSAHRKPVDTLASRAGWRVITGDTSAEERQEVVQAFQAGRLKGVGLTIAAGGLGITLTHASRVLFVDRDWTPANNLQAEDRVCRIGQERPVQILVLVSDHALDQRMCEILEEKTRLIDGAVENEADYQHRAEQLLEVAERENAARRERSVRAVLGRLGVARQAAAGTPEPELSEERRAAIRDAVLHLACRCDGAKERDGQGFAAGDVWLGHHLAATLDEQAPEDCYRTAERVLIKYRKTQLSQYAEEIWE